MSDETSWLKEISTGPQIGLYALAPHRGTYIEKDTGRQFTFSVQNPRIRVRAAVKSDSEKRSSQMRCTFAGMSPGRKSRLTRKGVRSLKLLHRRHPEGF
jgi:hypothetical protein